MSDNKAAKSEGSGTAYLDSLSLDIGKRIRQARIDVGMTQAELASQINRRQASVSAMENGKMEISAGSLARMAIAFEKPVSYFFPNWLTEMLKPDDLSADEAVLLTLAQQLTAEDLQRFIIQVRAVVKRNERQYFEWLEEASRRSS